MSKPSAAAARWSRIVQGHVACGLSTAAYCRRTRVPQPSFYAWRRKSQNATTFAEVRVAPATPADAGALEVHLSGERRIVVRRGSDRQTLLDLLATLEGGSGDVADREAGV